MGKIFSRQHIELFFLFFPETRIGHFMQIVSIRDNLLEMSNLVFLKIRKISPICCLLNYPRVIKVNITSDKKGIKIHGFFFLFLHENVCCGYSLEAPLKKKMLLMSTHNMFLC